MNLRYKSFLLLIVFFSVNLSTLFSASFTPGNLIIYRVGDGTNALVNTGSPIFLDEYTPAGVFVQSIALPTTASGSNHAIVASGTGASEGFLTLSTDNRYLVVTGYDGVAASSLSGTASATENRIIGTIDMAGNINTTTALTDACDGNNVRSAVSTNGTDLWIAGAAGGVRYATLGSTSSTQLSTTVTNVEQVNIFNSQMYITTTKGTTVRLGAVGTGVPTTAGQTITQLSGIPVTLPSPLAFFFADLDGTVPGVDVVYIADNTYHNGNILKYSLVGTTWTANDTIHAPGVSGLTGSVSGTTVKLYGTTGGGGATGGGSVYSFTDNTGYNGALGSSSSATVIVSAATDKAFRGITFAPSVAVTVPTSLQSKQSASDLSVFPNPTNGEITISLSDNIQSGHLTVYNSYGQEIYNGDTFSNQKLNFKEFGKGLYSFRFETNDAVSTKRVIVE